MDELYKEVLLEHYRNPVFKGKMIKPDIHKEDSNPLCGDILEIFVRVKKDVIKDIRFDGKGCAISMASADILAEHLKGKKIEYAKNMTREEMLELLGINVTVQRVKCAMLALSTIKKGIIEAKQKPKK